MIHSGALVYWDVEDYIKEANKQLNDNKNYKTLFQDLTEHHKNFVSNIKNDFQSSNNLK